jgi:hypothetical protein
MAERKAQKGRYERKDGTQNAKSRKAKREERRWWLSKKTKFQNTGLGELGVNWI